MKLEEYLTAKQLDETELTQRINAWNIYGEETLVFFCAQPQASEDFFAKLLKLRQESDHLILALPLSIDESVRLMALHLEFTDGLVLYDQPEDIFDALGNAQVAFSPLRDEWSKTFANRLIRLDG